MMTIAAGIVTPLPDSDATSITHNSIGELPLLPTLDGDLFEGFDEFLDDLPHLDDPHHLDDRHHQLLLDTVTVDTNLSPGIQDEVYPLLEPLSSQLPCPADKIDDEDVTLVILLSHYLFNHFFNGQKCTNCSTQVISQQSGHCNFCRMCFERMQSEVTVDVGVERDDNPNDANESLSTEEVEKARTLPSFVAFLKRPLRTLKKGSANAYRRKSALVATLVENDYSFPAHVTFTRFVHGMNGTLRWLHIPILLRTFSHCFGYHDADHPEIMSRMEQLVLKESQPRCGKFFFKVNTFRKCMHKDGVKGAKHDQVACNMTYIVRATLMMLDLIDIADSHSMVDVLINAFSADEVFPSMDDSAIVKYLAALHFTTSIVIEQCKSAFKKLSATSSISIADIYLYRAHTGTIVLDLLRIISLYGFIPALKDDSNILTARYPQLEGFLRSAFNPSSLKSYLVAMARNYETFDPDQVYLALINGEGKCGGGVWFLPLFQVAFISHLERTGFSSHDGGHCCAYKYYRRRKTKSDLSHLNSLHLISLQENNTYNDNDLSIRPTFRKFGPIRTDGTYENVSHVLMATICRPHHRIREMGVQNFLEKTINEGVKQFDFNFDESDEEKRCFERDVTMMLKKVGESSEQFKHEHRLRDSVRKLYHTLLLSQSGEDAESSRDIAYLIATP